MIGLYNWIIILVWGCNCYYEIYMIVVIYIFVVWGFRMYVLSKVEVIIIVKFSNCICFIFLVENYGFKMEYSKSSNFCFNVKILRYIGNMWFCMYLNCCWGMCFDKIRFDINVIYMLELYIVENVRRCKVCVVVNRNFMGFLKNMFF